MSTEKGKPVGTPVDLDALERLAKEATPGPWMPDGEDFWTVQGGLNMGLVAQIGNPAYPCTADEPNARYIAALSPDVVLSLVGEVRRLRHYVGASETLAASLNRAVSDLCDMKVEGDIARGERDALKRAVERVAHMAATLRAEAVTASPGVKRIANKIAGEIEARLEVS